MMRALSRPARVLTACVMLAGVVLPAAPALAAPPPSSPPPNSSAPPAAPPAPATLPQVPVFDGLIPPVPPPNNTPPPKIEPPDPNAGGTGGFTMKTQCIVSRATLPLERKPWPQDLLNINKAHDFATGAGQTIAVIDTGVSPHQYLGGRLLPGGDYVNPADHGMKDCDGHGTEVAGIIAANSGGAVGFNGMAPDSNILSIRTTSKNYLTKNTSGQGGEGRPAGTIESLASAIMWSIQRATDLHTKLVAINISLTSCITNPGSLDLNYKQLQSAINFAVAHDVVVVAAAGNKGDQTTGCAQDNDNPDPTKLNAIPIPPWLGDNVLSVGSVGQNGNPSDFSISGPWVKVAAPGESLISLDPANPSTLVNQSVEVSADSGANQGSQEPSPLNGTSFAAPYVTGLVSLVRQKYPQLSPQQIMRRIELTAQHPGGSTGRNNKVGYGMIDPLAALTATIPGENGGAPAQAVNIPAQLPPPYAGSSTPTIVALAGGGTALALLVLTAFTMHTIKRSRERRAASPNR